MPNKARGKERNIMLDFKVFNHQLYIFFKNNEVRGSIRNKQMFRAHYGYNIELGGCGGDVGDIVVQICYKGGGRPISFYTTAAYDKTLRNRKVSSEKELIDLLEKYGFNEDTRTFLTEALKDLTEQLEERKEC